MSLQSCTVADVEFHNEFTLSAKTDGQLTAVVGFFDVEFHSVPHKKSFTTSPYNIPTHWKQTVFLLHEPIALVAGKCKIQIFALLPLGTFFLIVLSFVNSYCQVVSMIEM